MSATLDVRDLPIDLLIENPWNPNRQNERVAKATRESLDAYDFVEPILVRPHPEIDGAWQIIGGAHRVKEARALGRQTVPGVVKDLDDVAAKKLTIILNETRGEADVALLGQLLAQLEEAQSPEDFLTGLPYTTGEIDHLKALAEVDWDDFARKDLKEPPAPPDQHAVTLALSPEQADRFQRFAEMLTREWKVELGEAVVRAVQAAAEKL